MSTPTFNEYQEQAKTTAIYPAEESLEYLTLGLVSEAGEVADKLKKHIRDDLPLNTSDLALELGDVLWYVALLADEIGWKFRTLAELNLNKLKSRQDREKLGGSGDHR